MITLAYKDIYNSGKPCRINAATTSDHPASGYTSPVILLNDGDILDPLSWICLGYELVSTETPHEAAMMAKWLRNTDLIAQR